MAREAAANLIPQSQVDLAAILVDVYTSKGRIRRFASDRKGAVLNFPLLYLSGGCRSAPAEPRGELERRVPGGRVTRLVCRPR
jgi:hypothetical protein